MARAWPVTVFALVYPTVLTVVYFVLLAGESAGIQQATYAVGKVIQFALPLFFLRSAARNAPNNAGRRWRGLAAGFALGAVVSCAALAIYFFWFKPVGTLDYAAEALVAKAAGIGVSNAWAFAALGAFYASGHSLLEEYYWRWFVFGRLRGMLPMAWAVAVSSVGFAAHHVVVLAVYFGWVSWLTWFLSAAVGVGGALWAVLYWRTGSLKAVWLSHALVDAAIFIIGYDMLRRSLG